MKLQTHRRWIKGWATTAMVVAILLVVDSLFFEGQSFMWLGLAAVVSLLALLTFVLMPRHREVDPRGVAKEADTVIYG